MSVSALKEMSNYTFVSKYARWLSDKKRRETWKEAVTRVKEMMLRKYPQAEEEIEWAYDFVYAKKVVGSMRNMQFGGAPVESKNERSYNCCSTYCNRARVFQECFFALLCGCGVGISVQKTHIDKLPNYKTNYIGSTTTWIIEDNIEGWSDAVGALLSYHFGIAIEPKFKCCVDCSDLTFDYSRIRPEGSYLSSSSGKAPGPKPLQRGLRKINELLLQRKQEGHSRLRPIDAYDIIMHIADCTLSGGVRRAAVLIMFDIDDTEMTNCKIGNWMKDNPQRARSNNSAMLLRDEVSFDAYRALMKSTQEYGEPGSIWCDSLEITYNPSLRGNTLVQTPDGLVPIKELVDKPNLEVKNFYGKWVPAICKLTGQNQQLYCLILENGEKIYCTKEHKWPLLSQDDPEIIKKATHELTAADVLISTNFSALSIIDVSATDIYEDVYDIRVDDDMHCFHLQECITGNCVEIGMRPLTESGESGFQFCNLSEINCSNLESEEDFYDRAKAASIIGTLQAGFTSFPYLGQNTEDITKREALLGVSLTGILDKPDIVLKADTLKKGAEIAKETNKKLSAKIGINQAARVTCTKPSGSTSTLLGCASGIHPSHSRRYIRHIQANILEDPLKQFKKSNPSAVEKSVWSANNTDEVLRFPIEVPDGSKTKNMLSSIEMLNIVKFVQEHWVNNGKSAELCTASWLSHNVSNTISVQDWDEVVQFVYENRQYFAGISFIPESGDKDYYQSPFVKVLTSREIIKEYGDGGIWCSGLIERALELFDNNLWSACDVLLYDLEETEKQWLAELNNNYASLNDVSTKKTLGTMLSVIQDIEVKARILQAKLTWITKARNFASKYFDGNIKQLTYCLKDVFNWKLWNDLKISFQHVDYEMMVEEEDGTNFEAEVACAGGQCSI